MPFSAVFLQKNPQNAPNTSNHDTWIYFKKIFLSPTLGFRSAFPPPSLLGKGDLIPVLKVLSAIHGFAAVSFIFFRHLFHVLPQPLSIDAVGSFFWYPHPFQASPMGEIVFFIFIVKLRHFSEICIFLQIFFQNIFIFLSGLTVNQFSGNGQPVQDRFLMHMDTEIQNTV